MHSNRGGQKGFGSVSPLLPAKLYQVCAEFSVSQKQILVISLRFTIFQCPAVILWQCGVLFLSNGESLVLATIFYCSHYCHIASC